MHLYNYIWVVLLVSRLNLAFLSPKLSRGIDKVLVCLSPYGFNNPRNTLRWKLLQLASIHLGIILFGLRTANRGHGEMSQKTWFLEDGAICPEMLIQQPVEILTAITCKSLTIWSCLTDHRKAERVVYRNGIRDMKIHFVAVLSRNRIR
jgi:hypothetical protein